jgi:hypothetical protein
MFQPKHYPIPPAELQWVQSLCDVVRRRIGPLYLDIKKHPHAYLPFLHSIPRDLESYNQELPNSKDAKPYKLFTLLPQKKQRPINIKINNIILADMHRYLKKDVELDLECRDP